MSTLHITRGSFLALVAGGLLAPRRAFGDIRDDLELLRYALTLESKIEDADPATAKQVREEREELLARMRGARRGTAEVDGFRRALVELILKLR